LRRTNDAKARQRNFQIAGVSFKQAPSIAYRDKKVDNFVFFFDPKKFETMRDALVEKYPKLGCESSQVKNAMGASFEQIICALQDAESVLKLKRFQDLNTSLLQLTSKKLIEETTEKKNKQKKDI
jgi:hypothetical protein